MDFLSTASVPSNEQAPRNGGSAPQPNQLATIYTETTDENTTGELNDRKVSRGLGWEDVRLHFVLVNQAGAQLRHQAATARH